MLFKYGDDFFGVAGSTLRHLQLLEACTAKCLVAAHVAQSSMTPFCQRFTHRLRLSTTDKHSSNLLCEQMLAKELAGADFCVVHQTCDVHVVYRVHIRVFALMDDHITGVVRHALSLSNSAHMNIFTKAVRIVIRERGGVRLIQGTPPLDAQRHRATRLKLFAARWRNVIVRRLLLVVLPNGDWRSRQVELYVPFDSQLTRDRAEVVVANGLVTALVGHMF